MVYSEKLERSLMFFIIIKNQIIHPNWILIYYSTAKTSISSTCLLKAIDVVFNGEKSKVYHLKILNNEN